MSNFPKTSEKLTQEDIIHYTIIKTKQRLTFDITFQNPEVIYEGDDDGDYYLFKASNGYEVISRSRMDIQTERLWLLGAGIHECSGSMVFSSDIKRDTAYLQFQKAIQEWIDFISN